MSEFYRAHEGLVMAFMRRRVGDAEVAADLTMEVFAAALLAIHKQASPPKNSTAWLFGIAHHKLIDYRRSGSAERRALVALGMERVSLDDADIERIDALTQEAEVMALLDELPPDQREAVRARVLEDRGYEEMAATGHGSETAIRQRLSRGLRSLRSEMEKTR